MPFFRSSRFMAVMDRDYNSALNRLHNGLQKLHMPVERRESTPVEIAQSQKQEAIFL
jgi:hypothetical protein